MLLGIEIINKIEGIKYDTPNGWEPSLEPFQLMFWGNSSFVLTKIGDTSAFCTVDLSKEKLIELKKIIDDLIEKEKINEI